MKEVYREMQTTQVTRPYMQRGREGKKQRVFVDEEEKGLWGRGLFILPPQSIHHSFIHSMCNYY